MKRILCTVALLATFFIGCVAGWRVTMRHAEVVWVEPGFVVMSTWGYEDIYLMEEVG